MEAYIGFVKEASPSNLGGKSGGISNSSGGITKKF